MQQRQIETLQKDLDELREFKRNYEREKLLAIEKTKTIEQLEKELAEAQNEIVLQKQQNNKFQGYITQLETEIKQLNDDKKQLSEENQQLRLQLKQMEEKILQTYSNSNWQEEKAQIIEETKKLQEKFFFTQQEKEKYAISLSNVERELQEVKQLLSEKVIQIAFNILSANSTQPKFI
jgi:chromosome segregation ATPase